MYDNVRLTPYDGTSYVAECHKAKQAVAVDGDLKEWAKPCPLPLIGANQLTRLKDGYAWTPANSSGVAYLQWDEKNLEKLVLDKLKLEEAIEAEKLKKDHEAIEAEIEGRTEVAEEERIEGGGGIKTRKARKPVAARKAGEK